MQSIKIYQIDSFTKEPFGGNPAAVCPLDYWLDDSLLLAIARENNLSETAFLVPSALGYEIRWFAPQAEVVLCGHATLAAAAVVFRFLQPELEMVSFRSPQYQLQVARQADGLVMDFPRLEVQEQALLDCPQALQSQDLQGFYEGNETLILRLSSEQAVRSYQPDLAFLKQERIFLSITAPGDQIDFVSRFFAPAIGIDEDPVTGSVHCLLAPIWSKILGKTQLDAVQLSQRQGKLGLTLAGNRVKIFGHTVCVMQGEIYPKGL